MLKKVTPRIPCAAALHSVAFENTVNKSVYLVLVWIPVRCETISQDTQIILTHASNDNIEACVDGVYCV